MVLARLFHFVGLVAALRFPFLANATAGAPTRIVIDTTPPDSENCTILIPDVSNTLNLYDVITIEPIVFTSELTDPYLVLDCAPAKYPWTPKAVRELTAPGGNKITINLTEVTDTSPLVHGVPNRRATDTQVGSRSNIKVAWSEQMSDVAMCSFYLATKEALAVEYCLSDSFRYHNLERSGGHKTFDLDPDALGGEFITEMATLGPTSLKTILSATADVRPTSSTSGISATSVPPVVTASSVDGKTSVSASDVTTLMTSTTPPLVPTPGLCKLKFDSPEVHVYINDTISIPYDDHLASPQVDLLCNRETNPDGSYGIEYVKKQIAYSSAKGGWTKLFFRFDMPLGPEGRIISLAANGSGDEIRGSGYARCYLSVMDSSWTNSANMSKACETDIFTFHNRTLHGANGLPGNPGNGSTVEISGMTATFSSMASTMMTITNTATTVTPTAALPDASTTGEGEKKKDTDGLGVGIAVGATVGIGVGIFIVLSILFSSRAYNFICGTYAKVKQHFVALVCRAPWAAKDRPVTVVSSTGSSGTAGGDGGSDSGLVREKIHR